MRIYSMLFLVAACSDLEAQDLQLVWADEFDGTAIDRSTWEFGSGPTNDNVHYYTDRAENARVVDGKLQIIAREEAYEGFAYTSALLHTKRTLNWRYGRIEAGIKLPGSPGFVPAFWMLPAGDRYGWWPLSGEVDIMEHPTNEGSNIYGTIHTEAYNLFSGISPPKGGVVAIADAQSAFHVYAVEWGRERIDFYVDDQKYFTYVNDGGASDTWPFHEPFYILLNLAVGGGWVGDPTEGSVFPATMEVDYVRLYQHAEDVIIHGPDDVLYNSRGISYMIPDPEGATCQWRVPGGAQIRSGQGTGRITVDWGIFGGDVEAEISSGQGSFLKKLPVRVSSGCLRNPGFENGVKYWSKREGFPVLADFRLNAGEGHQGEHSLRVDVSQTGANPWDVQLTQQDFQVQKGETYHVSFWAKSPGPVAAFNSAVIHVEDNFLEKAATITPGQEWARFGYEFTASATASAAFNLDLGGHAGSCYFDDLVITTDGLSRLNQLRNPDFFDGEEEWNLSTLASAEAAGSVADGIYAVAISNGGVNPWDIHLGQEGMAVVTGKEYTVSFDAFADAPRQISALVGKNEDPWTVYSGDRTISLTTGRETYTFSFVMEGPTDSMARLGFDIGGDAADVYFDNVMINQGEYAIHAPPGKPASSGPFTLLPNHPNPFSAATWFHYTLHRPAQVQLHVFDSNGREIRTLVHEFQAAGAYDIPWEAVGYPGGVYFYQLRAAGHTETGKLILVPDGTIFSGSRIE